MKDKSMYRDNTEGKNKINSYRKHKIPSQIYFKIPTGSTQK